MCGIAGIVRRTPGSAEAVREAGGRALASMRHRGPDAEGEYASGGVWLGHVRLSIIDLSAAANQPMSTSDGRHVIVYNGEVYNFRELARELSLEGLRSTSDTEVVLRAFDSLGTGAFRKLNGMFAFAIYDRQLEKLWLVRDRLGIKPLYYTLDEGSLIFASEIKTILSLRETMPACETAAIHEWLYYGNTLGERTFYRGIRRLLPGQFLEFDVREFTARLEGFWSVGQQAAMGSPTLSTHELVAETRRLLEEAVRRQLVSDVPVGVFLSGGVDSSAITAIASRHYSGRLATYSAGFDGYGGVDERPKARKLAARFGTDHHEVFISGDGLAERVEAMVCHHDAPFADAANLPLYLMASDIRSHTKVVLQGDGGDEVFGGYRRYVSLRYRGLMRALARMKALAPLLPGNSALRRRVFRYANAFAAEDVGTTMARLLTPLDPSTGPARIFAQPFRDEVMRADPFERYREVQSQYTRYDTGHQMTLVDLTVELPDIFLEKVDRATMAASLEVRVPFLDHDLVDFVSRLSSRQKMPYGRKKWLLKQALRGVVPDEILDGPKTGFNVPFAHWLRTSLKPLFFDHLRKFETRQPGVLSRENVEGAFTGLDRGVVEDGYLLWNLLNLMMWSNQTGISLGG